MVTKAKLKANERYIKGKTDEIKVRVPKGDKEKIKETADQAEMSVNAFINNAIQEKIERINKKST
ncbi:MAG: antitoxin [Ruminiclostridium sp.]